tara:strand:+ start:572 stop:1006 length:435 start_codon:yes stop_codon:yes gene_type:complete
MKFYLDTCIWLNLFKKEGNSKKGKPYWKIAEEFIETVIFSDNEIIYSNIVLREIEYVIANSSLFEERKCFMENEPKLSFVFMEKIDYDFARKLELKHNFELSFYDFLHIAICKRMNLVLVTRDNDMIRIGKNYISTDKPENLIC